jgi:hypothetical protein
MPEVDPGSPLFFLSYAHSQVFTRNMGEARERNWRFTQFFRDLSENLAELVSRPTGSDPGYMDLGYMDRSISEGERWNPELLKAIGTCQVFVALLSPVYFGSSWCGLEWHAFSQRRVLSSTQAETSNQTAILPVIWAPVREQDVPAVVKEVQWFYPRDVPTAGITLRYENDGVVGLLQLDDVAYKSVVWRLAQRIAQIHYSHRVEPGSFQFGELRNVFEEPTA